MAEFKVHIVNELCDWFLSNVVKAEPDSDEAFATYTEEEFERALKEAVEYLEMIREDEEQKLKRGNTALVNNQIESVKQATTIKINKAKATIRKLKEQGKTEEDSIVRLHKGRIRNFGISMEERLEDLEQKRAVSVGFNLIAGGIVKIEQ